MLVLFIGNDDDTSKAGGIGLVTRYKAESAFG